MSLEKLIKNKLALLFTAGTLAFSCCGKENNFEESPVREQYKSDISIKTGETNAEGKIIFADEQTGEKVTVIAQDKITGEPLPYTETTFTDGDGFEGFALNQPGYVPHFEVFSHNSTHSFELMPESYRDFTVFDYYYRQNPEQYNAFEKYFDWAKDSYTYRRCATKEELKREREYSVLVLSFGEYTAASKLFSVINTVLDAYIKLDEWGIVDAMPNPIYHVYEAIDFTAPPLVEGAAYEPEDCYDNIDNDCDGRIDFEDYDCSNDTCEYPFYECNGMYLTYCTFDNELKTEHCDDVCQERYGSDALGCDYFSDYDHDACLCY